ncbi:MAG: P-type ATPase [Syntrophales bacterium]
MFFPAGPCGRRYYSFYRSGERLLGFWRERGAVDAVEKLLSIVRIKTTALRDGSPNDIPIEDVVPGDVVILNAGDAIPADCLILESKDLFVDEATLTGESCPAEKETVNYRRKRH